MKNEAKQYKESGGKFDWSVVPLDILKELIKPLVVNYESGKYTKFGWKGGLDKDLCYAAMMRHMEAYFCDGKDINKDDGCHHLANVAAYCVMRIYADKNKKNLFNDLGFVSLG